MRISTPARLAGLALAASVVVSACSGGGEDRAPALRRVTVQLRWTHQSQFAGLYAAIARGFYRDEGLDVAFLEGGPTVDAVAPVLDGTAQFGMATGANVPIARAQGKQLRALAAVYRRYPLAVIVARSSGISRLEELRGGTVAITVGNQPVVRAMLAAVGMPVGTYNEILAPDLVAALESGQALATSGFVMNEASVLQARGVPVTLFYPDDYGVHFYGDTIVASDDLLARDPDLARRFGKASLEGWTWAVENPREAATLARRYMGDRYDADRELRFLTQSIPFVHTGEDRIGWMERERWAAMARTLAEQGVLAGPVDPDSLYSTVVLDALGPPAR